MSDSDIIATPKHEPEALQAEDKIHDEEDRLLPGFVREVLDAVADGDDEIRQRQAAAMLLYLLLRGSARVGSAALRARDFRLPHRLDLAVGVVQLRGLSGGHFQEIGRQAERMNAVGMNGRDRAVIGLAHLVVAGGGRKAGDQPLDAWPIRWAHRRALRLNGDGR